MVPVNHCMECLSMFHGDVLEGAADNVVVEICCLRAAIRVSVSAYRH